ncbi:MAG TPA: hypothetical protein VGI43_08850 [Mucilaginibacter sp.]|jgi:hypothetical protein
MKYPINVPDINKKLKFYDEVIEAHTKASEYINDFHWCKEVKSSRLYTNLGWVLCIFLFDIVNTSSEEDNLLWIIVGDLPSMYLDIYGATTTVQVLEQYTGLAEDWINQVKEGGPMKEVYPFNADPSIEMAEFLESRVNQIKNNLIPNIDEISMQEI